MTDHAPFLCPATTSPDVIETVCTYWAGLPRCGAAPARAALDATALAPVLAQMFIAELVTPRVARLRVVGHRIDDLMGMDLRGMPLTALMTAAARPTVADAVAQVGRGARAFLTLEGEGGFGQPNLRARLALLPLADGAGRLSHALGVMQLDGAPGRRPRRLAPGPAALSVLPPLAGAAPDRAKGPALRVIIGGRS